MENQEVKTKPPFKKGDFVRLWWREYTGWEPKGIIYTVCDTVVFYGDQERYRLDNGKTYGGDSLTKVNGAEYETRTKHY